jgi:tetratricopeptide (TPR) repeat protein
VNAGDNDDAALRGTGGQAASESLVTSGAALVQSLSHDPRAQVYFEEQMHLWRHQARLNELQGQYLREQNAFELSHLRFRRASDFARLAFEVAAALLGLLLLSWIGATVWSAISDNGIVVEAFSVPADIAQSGMTGGVLAGRVLDKYGRMQADTISLTQGTGSYRSNVGDQLRVEIPNTGISLDDLVRTIRKWLGHETHVTGDLVHTAKGLALTVRYGQLPGKTVEAGAADLDKLIDSSAEQVFAASRPLRYADYLSLHKRFAEAEAVIVPLAGSGTAAERALAYVSWATLSYSQGDSQAQLDRSEAATRLDPTDAAAWYILSSAANSLGHDETSLEAIDRIVPLLGAGGAGALDPKIASGLSVVLKVDRDSSLGDSLGYVTACQSAEAGMAGTAECDDGNLAFAEADLHDFAEARRLAALSRATHKNGDENANRPGTFGHIAARFGDWAEALRFDRAADAIIGKEAYRSSERQVFFWPELAEDLAMTGDASGAEALIGRTPLDCDACARARGRIAAARHDWPAAEHWFALVAARSPKIPFADTDWGAMLLRKGDLTSAISKFVSANRKGPNFADPLEMWGEALMRENRSDLALAKFAAASKLAPNWGRLHLKWGEAQFYAGHGDNAIAEFAVAENLVLSAAERAELARARSTGGARGH